MVDITNKINTHFVTQSGCNCKSQQSVTIDAVNNKTVPERRCFLNDKAAAFAVKHTSDVIPDCHPAAGGNCCCKFQHHRT